MRRAFLVLLALSLTATAARALTIRGDRHWVGNIECPEGWRLLEFDDSSWTPVTYPWPRLWPRDWPLDPQARPIWGVQPSRVNCVRRAFDLETLPSAPAVAHIWVDDDYELFVNGIPVGSSNDHSAEMPGETYDITPVLRLGKNVVAIRGIDNGGIMAMLVSLDIPDVPDPAATLQDRIVATVPWATFAAVILFATGWVLAVRRMMHRAEGLLLSPATTVVATVLLTAAAQLFFGLFVFYTAHREMPLASWNWGPVVPIALVLTALAAVRAPAVSRALADEPVHREQWWLLGILVIATMLRTYNLDSMPPGFFQDEATNGNDALAIGQLEHMAIWSDSIGGRPTLFLYMLSAVLKVIGTSYLKLKVVPLVLGVAGVAATYAVGRLAVGPRTALWAAFLLGVSRWDVHYSRMAWEAICVPLFASAGLALLLDGFGRRWRAPISLIAAAVVLAGGLYTYAAYRAVPGVVLVFLLATLLSPDRDALRGRWGSLLPAGVVAACIAAPLAIFAWEQPDLYWYRYSEVSLTSYMAYYATPMPWLHQLGKGLLSLTSVGDEIVRHNLPSWPHLDRVTGGLMLIGMATALGVRGHRGLRLLWCWFATFMALATLTMDAPHATRLLGVAPVVTVFAGFGVACLLREIAAASRPAATVAAAAIAVVVASLNAYQYFVLQANYPGADFEYDVTGRSLCEYMRRLPVSVDLHWTEDIAYWADGQCLFLARDRYTVRDSVKLNDVFPGNRFEGLREPTVVVIGQEFIERNHGAIRLNADDRPRLNLPGEAFVARDRDGKVLYYLYAIALPTLSETS